MWEKVVEKAGLNVKYSHYCESVEFIQPGDFVNVTVKNTCDDVIKTEQFDFCIFSMPEPLRILKNPTYKQGNILSRFCNYRPVVTFVYEVDCKNWPIAEGFLFDNESKCISEETQGLGLYRKNKKVCHVF